MSEYAKALDELEEMRKSGKITEGRYQEMRAKLLAEASRPKRSLAVTLLTGFALVVAVLVVIWVVGRIFG